MRCPFCGGPNIQSLGGGYFICLDCGEEFSAYSLRSGLKIIKKSCDTRDQLFYKGSLYCIGKIGNFASDKAHVA